MKKNVKITIGICASLIILIVIFLIFFDFVVIYGNSMKNTYSTGDVVIYRRTQEIDYNNVIVFSHDDKSVIKRVVGLSGDVIEIKNNTIYRNGEQVKGCWIGESADLNAVKIDENCVFVLGDNLSESKDSRTYGAINKNTIKGRVI